MGNKKYKVAKTAAIALGRARADLTAAFTAANNAYDNPAWITSNTPVSDPRWGVYDRKRDAAVSKALEFERQVGDLKDATDAFKLAEEATVQAYQKTADCPQAKGIDTAA